jgi:hypothetical protein
VRAVVSLLVWTKRSRPENESARVSAWRKDPTHNKSYSSQKEPSNLDPTSRRFTLERVVGQGGSKKNTGPSTENRGCSRPSAPLPISLSSWTELENGRRFGQELWGESRIDKVQHSERSYRNRENGTPKTKALSWREIRHASDWSRRTQRTQRPRALKVDLCRFSRGSRIFLIFHKQL